jgi:osmotically-inducible protein OsmY
MKRHTSLTRSSASRAAMILAATLLGSFVGACTSMPTQQPAAEAIDDGVVTAKVKAALTQDPVTKAHQINVETFKGEVQLSGFVESDQARSRALQLARDIQGVRRVKDAMEVRTGG